MAARGLQSRLAEVFTPPSDRGESQDPDHMLYSGGFFSDADKQAMARVRQTPPETLAGWQPAFEDPRLPEMLFRYRARNWPATLNAEELQRWQRFCQQRLIHGDGAGPDAAAFRATLARLRQECGDATEQSILDALEVYGEQLLSAPGLPACE